MKNALWRIRSALIALLLILPAGPLAAQDFTVNLTDPDIQE